MFYWVCHSDIFFLSSFSPSLSTINNLCKPHPFSSYWCQNHHHKTSQAVDKAAKSIENIFGIEKIQFHHHELVLSFLSISALESLSLGYLKNNIFSLFWLYSWWHKNFHFSVQSFHISIMYRIQHKISHLNSLHTKTTNFWGNFDLLSSSNIIIIIFIYETTTFSQHFQNPHLYIFLYQLQR